MVVIEYQYLNGVSVLDSCTSCTGLELIIDNSDFILCGQKYFELRIVEVVYDDAGNQIIYFTYNGDVYGTTMTFNDFLTATQGAFECPPNAQCVIQETSFDWAITPQSGDKYVSNNIVRPAGTTTDYIYSFLDLTINGITYTLGNVWDDATQGKACDNVKDYIDAIIYYLENESIPEYLGANNLAENGMTNNFNGDLLMELFFQSGTTVSIQIQDTGGNTGNFNYVSSVITQAILTVNNTSVLDVGDGITGEALEVTDGQLFRASDNSALPLVIYSAYEFEYNFNLANALVISLCINTQYSCLLNNFVQVIITPTQMQSVLGGATITGSTGTSNTPPANIGSPYIFGIGAEGGILNVNSGLWTGVPTPSFTYDWQYSSDGGLTWNSYSPPEIGTSYLCLSTDVGNLIRCEVTATNIVSSVIAYSNSILVVAGGNCSPSNVVAPSISGATTVGSILTANNGTWLNAVSYNYDWLRNGVSIGVITSTYTTVSTDAGQNIQCIVTAINPFGQCGITTNDIIPTIVPSNIIAPIVYGDVSVGSVLSVYEGEWDGYPIPLFAYNWQYSNDGGVTWNNYSPLQLGSTYTIVSGDLGNTIRCQVDATNIEGIGSADSAGVFIPLVCPPTAPTFAVNPTMNVLGTSPIAGVYLEVTDGMCNGTDPIAFSYQWKNNGSPIIGETNSTYEIQLSDFGDLIECEVTASNGVLPNATFTPTGVTIVQKPNNTIAPSLSGASTVGSLLTTTNGTWTGNTPITYSYQWYSDCDMVGTNAPTYTVQGTDVGKLIYCKVTASNAYGNGDAQSNSVYGEKSPTNIVAPIIYGDNMVGGTLYVDNGQWVAYPAITSYSYLWEYSSDNGSTWNLYSPSQIGSTYTITTADIGRLIRCSVSAISPIGSGNVVSNSVFVDSAPINTVAPVISYSSLVVGSTLTCSQGTWIGSGTILYAYQWTRNGVNIVGANTNTRVTTSADAGQNIECIVTATNSITSTIAVSAEVIPTIAPSNVTIPIVYGDVSVGSVLSVYEGEWDGYPTPSFTYNWQWSNDGGTTWNNFSPVEIGNTYTIVSSDLGNTIRCQVDGTNIEGVDSVNSSSVLIPTAYTPTSPTFAVNPIINVLGAFPIAGVYLEVTDGMCNGTDPIAFSYQWKNNGSSIIGETNSTYEIQLSDFGDLIECEVTASNGILPDATFTPTGVTVVQKPINTVLPSISGLLPVGSVLTATTGTWTGNAPITYSYQWRRNQGAIPLATTSTYTTVSADAGQTIDCVITATNAYGFDEAISSNSVVPELAPVNTLAPSIYGNDTVGSVLTVGNGCWDGFPTLAFSYNWQYSSDNINWNDYSPLSIGSTYTILASDVNLYIRCQVTATNGVLPTATANTNSILIPRVAPLISGTPTITGVAIVTQVLTCNIVPLTISGFPAPSVSYQWYRADAPISLATSSTYTLVAADAGEKIVCRVTATNALGTAYVDTAPTSIFLTIADKYPTGAAHGWNMFLLIGSYYGSPLLQVRRASDNATLDIGSDANGYLDVGLITTHCTGTSGFVSVFYDQLGGKHFTQTTNSLQYRIFSGGALDTQNLIACLNATATTILMSVAGTGGVSGDGSFNFLHDGTTQYTVFTITTAVNANAYIITTQTSSSLGVSFFWRINNSYQHVVYNNATTIVVSQTLATNGSISNKQYITMYLANFTDSIFQRKVTLMCNDIQVNSNVSSGTPSTGNPANDIRLGGGGTNRVQGVLIYKTRANAFAIWNLLVSQYNIAM